MFTGIACEVSGDPETPRPHGMTSPPNGGIYAIQGSDTPATHRQSASHGAKPPPTTSHQQVTLHNPDSKAECAAYTTNRTERKGDARQFPAQQEPRPLITRSGLSLTRTRSRETQDRRESEVETGGERSRGRVRLHRMFHRSPNAGNQSPIPFDTLRSPSFP